MANLLKAFVLFTFGFAILANLGDALEKRGGAVATDAAGSLSDVEGRNGTADGPKSDPSFAGLAEKPLSGPERPSPVEEPSARTGSYAQVCASFDPVARPGEVIDILEYASGVTGTPVDVLFSVWQKETGFLHGDGRMSGGCDLKSELERRDRDAGTDHWNAMLAMADRFGWKQRYGNDLERMTCSCPKERVKGQYGGCCGPFQFSGQEVAHQYAIPRGLDPMTFCGGALIAGWELKKHHDNAFRPDRNRGWPNGRGGYVMARHGYADREHAAWHAAMSRYYGGDVGDVYGSTAVMKWKTFYAWQQDAERIYAREPADEKRRKIRAYLAERILDLGNTKYSLRKLRTARAEAD